MNSWITGGLASVAGLLSLTQLKTGRSDGDLVNIHPYRRMMFYIMPGRNESVVYFDRAVRAERLEAYIEQAREAFGANMTHVLTAAVGIGLGENPKMNQFVVGRRLYARRGRWVTFSMKRQKLNKQAKLSAVKMEMQDGETFRELVTRINGQVQHERSGERTDSDKEFDILNLLPRPGLNLAANLLRALDYYNLMPAFFIKGDGMYTSAFIANLGSVGMGAGYHHLYEYGTCPLFIMVGQVEERPVVEDGKVVVGRVLPIRFSYDERIADGLTARFGIESVARVLEDPFHWLGCLAPDDSDRRPMFPHGETIDVGDNTKPIHD
ncbi:MAG TPA: 2-oxo acid dehydrogenase subunit E2 [Myxococcota bacterium]|nr:2-oxo acid dehydrogenase subunit E2 [Myxococcota bacterium]